MIKIDGGNIEIEGDTYTLIQETLYMIAGVIDSGVDIRPLRLALENKKLWDDLEQAINGKNNPTKTERDERLASSRV